MEQARNVPAQIKNVEVMLELVYTRKMKDNVIPFNIEYRRNKLVAVDA